MKRERVIVAMSGGVDSSVAAALLQQQGYEVMGVTMDLFSLPRDYCRSEKLRSCCGWKAVEDAHRVATLLGIPHYVADLKKDFEKKVISDFCEQYVRGRTPNPCIRCNQYIKFQVLMDRAEKLDAHYLATGHHARIEYDSQTGRFHLKKGKDREKEQSYFLYPLTQNQLSRTLMPVGHFTKRQVRGKAHDFGLPVAQRPESQEVCFIPDHNYSAFLQKRMPQAFRSGPIVNVEHEILGYHQGIAHFTVGQRRGMGLAAPHPLYVVEIQGDKNRIVVGRDEDLHKRELIASHIHLISGERVEKSLAVKAKIRYKHQESKAVLFPLDSTKARVWFKSPQRAITPGQSIVFYDGDIVVGGGIIEKAL
ncbi:MAG: tRNA 2-thiouridine(34) synthase MnmA [Candidatus Aminicenantes bacterium]